MKNEIRYEIDPYNNLVAVSGRKTSLNFFREVLRGKFSLGKNNELVYTLRQSPSKTKLPKKVILKGSWSLTKDHELKLTFEQEQRKSFGKSIVLKGQIIAVKKNKLLFSIRQRTASNKTVYSSINLQGQWQMDKYNRINFNLTKESSPKKNLIFLSKWQIDKNHRLIYKYSKLNVQNGIRKTHYISFDGTWKVLSKYRIKYIIDSRTDVGFDIKVSLQKLTGRAIDYDISIGAGKNKESFTLHFSGKWKLTKNTQVFFEIKKENNKRSDIQFSSETQISLQGILACALKYYGTDKKIGYTIKFKRGIKSIDGQIYAKILKNSKEKAVFIGVGGKF